MVKIKKAPYVLLRCIYAYVHRCDSERKLLSDGARGYTPLDGGVYRSRIVPDQISSDPTIARLADWSFRTRKENKWNDVHE